MGALEEVTQMKNQGMNETDITNSLQGKFSPTEINDALAQSQIKNAISSDNINPPIPQIPNQTYAPQTREVENYSPQEQYTPTPQEYAPSPSQEYTSQDSAYPQEQYVDYASTGTDNMIEVAEQVFAQKMRKIQKQLGELTEFKTLSETKIEMNQERLKRMENIIDKLQVSILNKIGSYGDNLQSIKKEMSMMQDSFGKVISQATRKHSTHKTKKISKKK